MKKVIFAELTNGLKVLFLSLLILSLIIFLPVIFKIRFSTEMVYLYIVIVVIFFYAFVGKFLFRVINKKLEIHLDDNNVILIVLRKNGKVLHRDEYKWSEIMSYCISVRGEGYIVLKIKRNYKNKTWQIKEDKEIKNDQDRLFNVFLSAIKEYNLSNTENKTIYWQKGFLNSTIGKVMLYSAFGFAIIAFIVHLVINPSASFYGLMGAVASLSAVYGQKLQEKRQNDKVAKDIPLER